MSPVRAERIALLSAQVEALAEEARHWALLAATTEHAAVEVVSRRHVGETLDALEIRIAALRSELQGVLTDAAGAGGGLPC